MSQHSLNHWSSDDASGPLAADPAGRIAWLSVLLTLPLLFVAIRAADLQGRQQSEFLSVFSQTHTAEENLPARNGRILAADGSVLADDVTRYDLLAHYRWLEQPADPQWLKRQAWSRLSRSERRQSALVAAEIVQVQARRAQLWRDVGALTGRSSEELYERTRTIQQRVESVWWTVNERREQQLTPPDSPVALRDLGRLRSLWSQLQSQLTEPPVRTSFDPLVIREQEEFHPLLMNISPDVAAEIESHPERYPGLRIAVHTRRVYPQGELAAHWLGVRTALTPDEAAEEATVAARGRSGLERQYDRVLQGRRGRRQTILNRHGEVLRIEVVDAPQHGQDLVLTLDLQLQQRAEQLLDGALEHVPAAKPADDEAPKSPGLAPEPPRGGCLVALEVHTGAVLVAASAPRFDANWLIAPDVSQWNAAAADPRKPFFPRVTQMAVPPGSVFKAATAIALLESGTFHPQSTVTCRGYLDQPDQYRCLTFRHYGVGHGDMTLSDALCRSCNVYFFTGARKAGPDALIEWSSKLGIGQPTGIDVPGEVSGRLPRRAGSVSDRSNVGDSRRWYPGDTLGLAIGQSSLTVTPLQMARLMAAIANDGFLVTPHLVASGGPATMDSPLDARPVFAHPEPTPIDGLHHDTLAAVRAGLYRVVHDPHGTAYHTVRLSDVAVAGKTGTAEVGGGLPDHAWFAGYVPADRPRIAFAIVLEHGGSGGKVAGPVAREFVKALLELGLLASDADLAELNSLHYER